MRSAEAVVVAAVLVALALFRCSVPPASVQVHATILERSVEGSRAWDPKYFMVIEYRERGGALVHEQIEVSEPDFRRYRRALEVCATPTVDGYRLTDCGE